VIVAVLAGVFSIAAIIPNLVPLLICLAIVLVGVGVLTGQ